MTTKFPKLVISEDAPEDPTPPDVRGAGLAELGLMSAAMLHEVRQPLFALKAHAQLLAASGDDRSALILDQVAHLEELVDFYGSFGRGGGPAMPFDLNTEIRRVTGVLDSHASRRGVALRSELAPGALWLQGRATAARQIVVNLVRNAIEALEGTPDARVVVRSASGPVLEVEDNGPGLPPDVAARLFQPWVTTKGCQGTGLGLYLTRELARELGGDVELAESQTGARFVVRLS